MTAIQRAGTQRLDYSEAEQMLRAGHTQQEVGDHFGVSQGAVAVAIARGNINYDSGRAKGDAGVIPWSPIRVEHRSRHLVRMLRAAGRRAQGKTSAPFIEAQLDQFLESARELDFVIHYDPDTPQGFHRVPRRPGVDTWLVRDPYRDDEGRFIRRPNGAKPKQQPPVYPELSFD